MKRALTDAFLRAAHSPASGRLEIQDAACRGLTLRITANGIRSWSFRYRLQGVKYPLRAAIGQYPTVSLVAARAAADALRKDVAGGGNPAEQRRERRRGGKTFGVLAERYLAEYARRKKRSHAADDRNLRKHVLPKWKGKVYASIRRAHVIELVEGIVAAGKPTLANRVQSLISGIFTFAMDADLVEANPCNRLQKRGVETVGTRVLRDPEICIFWQGIVEPEAVRRTGLGLRLALLTAARIGEVAGLCRAELDHIEDRQRAAWIIPGARTKNKLDHLIPLSPPAREIVLDLLQLIEPKQQFLFPTRSRRRDVGPMRATTFWQALDNFSDRLEGANDVERTWLADRPSPHDLRRTVETRMAGLRIAKEIRDRVLNHIPVDVGSKHYNFHDYADEKREALHRWSLALTSLAGLPIEGGAVVSIARRQSRS